MITIDSRETRSSIPGLLNNLGIPTEIAEMAAGDYRLGPFLVERKTANDLVASIMDGRLFEQAEAICLSAERPMLLIEGDLKAVASAIDYESLLGAVSALSITASVPSQMALATSDASARVGRGLVVIDSSICVAVMESFPYVLQSCSSRF